MATSRSICLGWLGLGPKTGGGGLPIAQGIPLLHTHLCVCGTLRLLLIHTDLAGKDWERAQTISPTQLSFTYKFAQTKHLHKCANDLIGHLRAWTVQTVCLGNSVNTKNVVF